MKVLSNNINMMKSFKSRGMETGYFAKIFHLKKDESCIQRMNKKQK